MNTNTTNILEFNIILEKLSNYALSENAKKDLLCLSPFLSERECRIKMEETTKAHKLLNCIGTPPLASMKELDKILALTEKGSMLIPEQLTSICSFISSCNRMKGYLKKAEHCDVSVALYGNSFNELNLLFSEINSSIRNGIVDDVASPTLRNLRRKIESTSAAVKIKLETILRSKKEYFSDLSVVIRNGKFVLPVKKEYKNKISGAVIDTSSTGGTCFIEPTAVGKLQEELALLQIDEDNEVRKILYTLTALVEKSIQEIKMNKDCMETLDFIFAKAKLSQEMKAIPVPVTTKREIIIKQGRHPLLNATSCVPLNFEIGGEISGVVITGPNTGGKTVTLKTVGLLSLMAQSGLHVPVEDGSKFCMHSNILCDIGDGQSISQNLSTFSAHITNIVDILKNISNESLVLLDELGSGTDPAEGKGLAIAILDELRLKKCLFVATTHYPEIKEFAKNTTGLINARMEFDRENLRPLYQLQIGEAGESCALYIAQKLGLPAHMLNRAQKEAYSNPCTQRLKEKITFAEADNDNATICPSVIQKETIKNNSSKRCDKFNIGDSVTVYPQKEVGIVYKTANKIGEISVQIKGKKQLINHKRLKLLATASELYPDNYDFSIIFDTVANRKARYDMERKHNPNLEIVYNSDNDY